LEERILKAAQRLCRTRGEEAVTLRAVAREARTTTPTVYKRFRSKEALRLALARRIGDERNQFLFSSSSVEDTCRRYLQFSEEHPAESMLLRAYWPDVVRFDPSRPGMHWMLGLLARRFGGKPEDYTLVFYALYLTCHGASSLLTVPADAASHKRVRDICIKICDTLIQNVEVLRPVAATES
jgi:AcrR family transcriptional regulator